MDFDILYVIHTNYTNRPVQDTISKIRNAGGQGNILALLENQNEDILKHLEISLYFQIFVAVLTGSGSYDVLEKCAYCNDGVHTFQRINVWVPKEGFKNKLKFPESFKGSFHHGTIKVTQQIWKTDKNPRSYKTKKLYRGRNPHAFMLYDLSKLLKFQFAFIKPVDYNEKGLFVNGTWIGIMGSLINGEADLAVGHLYLLEDYVKAATPTPVVGRISRALVSAKPKKR